jgi:hypothetical protein
MCNQHSNCNKTLKTIKNKELEIPAPLLYFVIHFFSYNIYVLELKFLKVHR